MKVLVVADSAEERSIVRIAVLEALQNVGECLTTSHKDGEEICRRKNPDLVIVCNYDEVSPMVRAVGLQSYAGIKKIGFEKNLIRMGGKSLPHSNYCNNTESLKAMVRTCRSARR